MLRFFEVFHATNMPFPFNTPTPTDFPTNFTSVATVTAKNLDHVYQLTNHIDSNWTENDGIEAPSPHVRSTSIGDVIVNSSVERFMVTSAGFTSF